MNVYMQMTLLCMIYARMCDLIDILCMTAGENAARPTSAKPKRDPEVEMANVNSMEEYLMSAVLPKVCKIESVSQETIYF